MNFDHITKLSPEELHEKALKFKEENDYDNYWIYITMSANYDYKIAIDSMNNYKLFEKQSYPITKQFYETTKDYSYSVYHLALLYAADGIGVVKDYNKTKELFEIAIIKDNSCAMFGLGVMYENGIGVSQNYKKAKELYETAIEKGNSKAMTNLISMYRSSSIPNNKSDVINYFLKINKPEKLQEIYNYDDCVIELLIENNKLKSKNNELEKKINELETHIMASPDGELYFEAKENWDVNLKQKIVGINAYQ